MGSGQKLRVRAKSFGFGLFSSLGSGMPDGVFSNQKSKFWEILGLAMEDVVYFMDTWSVFMAIWYILWTFGIFCGNLVYFPRMLVCCTKKNLATRPGVLIY
jgi:hypothetical protein